MDDGEESPPAGPPPAALHLASAAPPPATEDGEDTPLPQGPPPASAADWVAGARSSLEDESYVTGRNVGFILPGKIVHMLMFRRRSCHYHWTRYYDIVLGFMQGRNLCWAAIHPWPVLFGVLVEKSIHSLILLVRGHDLQSDTVIQCLAFIRLSSVARLVLLQYCDRRIPGSSCIFSAIE